jgi:hypothetical protein
VELVARDIEVGEVVVLLLYLQISVREMPILLFDGSQVIQDVLLVVLEPRDPREELLAELLPFRTVLGGVVLALLDLSDSHAKPLILLEDLLRELSSPAEKREELLGSPEDLLLLFTHAEPFR